eukprot:c38430_g1_i1 orf=91-525(-)
MASKYLDRALAAPLLLLNFAFYVIVLSIAGYSLDILMMNTVGLYGNPATPNFVLFSLLAGAIGLASIIAARHLIKDWSTENISAIISTALMAWLLLLVAFGLACKEISIGHTDTNLKFMEAFVITLTATNALYLLVLFNGYHDV